MLKEKQWRNGNHMLIDTGHRAFDKCCDLITTGNVSSHVQLSTYVRPDNELECNGRVNPPGHLRDFDLKMFGRFMSTTLRAFVLEQTKTAAQPIIVYMFFHLVGDRRIVHGWIVTDYNHKLIRKFCTGPTYKSRYVIAGVTPYITEAI